jgi:hypothetical protein
VTEIEQIINQDQRLFWDKAAINSEDDRYVIAERILEWGTEEEVRTVLSCYGKDFVRRVVAESRNLSPKTVNYFSVIFGIPREATRCFSDASPQIWRPY